MNITKSLQIRVWEIFRDLQQLLLSIFYFPISIRTYRSSTAVCTRYRSVIWYTVNWCITGNIVPVRVTLSVDRGLVRGVGHTAVVLLLVCCCGLRSCHWSCLLCLLCFLRQRSMTIRLEIAPWVQTERAKPASGKYYVSTYLWSDSYDFIIGTKQVRGVEKLQVQQCYTNILYLIIHHEARAIEVSHPACKDEFRGYFPSLFNTHHSYFVLLTFSDILGYAASRQYMCCVSVQRYISYYRC